MQMRLVLAILLGVSLTMPVLAPGSAQLVPAAPPSTPDQIDYAMSSLADVRDSPECRPHIADDHLGFDVAVSNPAMTCPDAFAWSLFARVVAGHFWEDWATDRETWPSDPWPRCRDGQAADRCCPAVEVSNDPAPEHCPVFPGSTPGVPAHQVRAAVTAHKVDPVVAAGGAASPAEAWSSVPAVLKTPVIGALQDELIYRNQPMIRYIFDNELYYVESLGRMYDTYVRTLGAYAPRWPAPPDPARSHPAAPPLTHMAFPVRAMMVKVDWLSADLARQVGINPDDSMHPFITMDLVPRDTGRANKPPAAKRYLLLAMHISSKDVPNWFWASFEHVANQGRCDWLGCNDSFGFAGTKADEAVAIAPTLPQPATNYTPPHKLPKLDGSDVTAFDLARPYPDTDAISGELAQLFARLDIGTASSGTATGRPTQQDRAWRSYRLKGSQTDFVTSTGVPRRLGNSVTEAGFTNSASCLTCHARAAVTSEGVPAFAIFTERMSDAGLAEGVIGSPDPAWFSVNAFFGQNGQREAPQARAVQTDFVWGFRFACPIKSRPLGPSWCRNVTGAGYSEPVPVRVQR